MTLPIGCWLILRILLAETRLSAGSYDSREWVIKVVNRQTSDILLSQYTVWLTGTEALLTSITRIPAKQAVKVSGE